MNSIAERLRGEMADAENAAALAAAGRSLTGFSNREERIDPIAGTRVSPLGALAEAHPEPDSPVENYRAAGPARVAGAERQRVPFGTLTQRLFYPPIPGFRIYWFNDTPGKIERAIAAGYDHVRSPTGEPVARVTGRDDSNRPIRSYLMKIPMQWYEEDQATQQAADESRLREISQGRGVDLIADANQYVPKQGITIRQGVGRR
jgi:hypothetical protein